MIMKKNYYILFLLLSLSIRKAISDPIICFFFKPQPAIAQMAQKLKKPGKIAKHTIHGIAEHVPIAGIYATYSGYIAISDIQGEVRFPRKQRENSVTILVTTDMIPVSLFENAIHHWDLMPSEPAQMYSLKAVYDATLKGYVWETQQIELPQNNQVPVSTIVILAKPKNIFIPSEKTKTVITANLMLPAIYVKKGINIMSQGINTLTIRHLFRPIQEKIERRPLRVITHLLN